MALESKGGAAEPVHTPSGIPSGIKNETLLASRRERLVDKTTRLFIERGYSEVPVSEIADYAGISVGSLYKYIRAKEDILWLVMGRIYKSISPSLCDPVYEGEPPLQRLERAFHELFRLIDEVRSGVLLMYREYRHLPKDAQLEFMAAEKDVVQSFQRIIEEGNEQGSFDCPSPPLVALGIIMAAHTWSLKRWLLHDVTAEEFTAGQWQLVKRQIGVNG